MNKTILITGTKGFLGSSVCKYFKQKNYKTYGIGHGDLSVEKCKEIGLDCWKKDEISVASILEFNQKFDVIVHCGGSGSVGFSVEYPYHDFKKTVDGTLEVLEYMRIYNSDAHLIYPSSPAVQGECEDKPIKEEYIGKPASPYGYHKKIAEDLCQSYSEKYTLRISIIRLFSVYGIGLKKQLLWDAYHKIKGARDEVLFLGTGEETRDFIHVDDVLLMMEKLLDINNNFIVINGGTGVKHKIKDVVNMIRDMVNKNVKIRFNNKTSEGNPIHYWADLSKFNMYGFTINVKFEEGLKNSINWMENIYD